MSRRSAAVESQFCATAHFVKRAGKHVYIAKVGLEKVACYQVKRVSGTQAGMVSSTSSRQSSEPQSPAKLRKRKQ
jgi:hypothetical protein